MHVEGFEFARFYLNRERWSQALPVLRSLREGGVAEAVFHLGTMEIRQGRLHQAVVLMEEALELNPGHKQTEDQLNGLRAALEAQEGS
jgi:Flp pilus assembly protein TadD